MDIYFIVWYTFAAVFSVNQDAVNGLYHEPVKCPKFMEGASRNAIDDWTGVYKGDVSDENCISMCEEMRKQDTTINGVSIASGGCYCVKDMVKSTDETNWKSCIFRHSLSYCPTSSRGYGNTGDWECLNPMSTAEECFHRCQEKHEEVVSINGITKYSEESTSYPGHCHCFKNMVRTNTDDKSESCLFPDCQHGFLTGMSCSCHIGWTGNICGTAICDRPCQNGGYCVQPNECRCTAEWTGPYCNKIYCLHGEVDSSWKRCNCWQGWQGIHCEDDIDECQQKKDACKNSNCTNTPGSYNCTCWKGYEYDIRDQLNRTCLDKDECKYRVKDQKCDRKYGICENTPGSFKCGCKNGYKLDPQVKWKCIEKRFNVIVNVPKGWKEGKKHREYKIPVTRDEL